MTPWPPGCPVVLDYHLRLFVRARLPRRRKIRPPRPMALSPALMALGAARMGL